MDLKKSLLDHVLSGDRIPREPLDKLEELLRMASNQQLEAGDVASQVLADQCLVRWRVHALIVCLRRCVCMVRIPVRAAHKTFAETVCRAAGA